ncbi:hypothetical protein K9M74_04425 [Candidatus Woesearchaeota archaeon]|nr:hypothetical protein [Candidatus Woesearchaeota archaeon]
MMKKRAQAAMEFLMTYGWAILVVLLAIAALAYFGVLSPENLLPERTTFGAPLANVDNAVIDGATNSLEVAFVNNKGTGITLPMTGALTAQGSTVCANAVINATYNSADATGVTIPQGETFLVTWDCDDLGTVPSAGTKFKADLQFDYVNAETGQTIPHTGSVQGKYS